MPLWMSFFERGHVVDDFGFQSTPFSQAEGSQPFRLGAEIRAELLNVFIGTCSHPRQAALELLLGHAEEGLPLLPIPTPGCTPGARRHLPAFRSHQWACDAARDQLVEDELMEDCQNFFRHCGNLSITQRQAGILPFGWDALHWVHFGSGCSSSSIGIHRICFWDIDSYIFCCC